MNYDPGYDCEQQCVCDDSPALCPNVQAFGAAYLKYMGVKGGLEEVNNTTTAVPLAASLGSITLNE